MRDDDDDNLPCYRLPQVVRSDSTARDFLSRTSGFHCANCRRMTPILSFTSHLLWRYGIKAKETWECFVDCICARSKYVNISRYLRKSTYARLETLAEHA
ncbi:hypothetical protein ACS0PU_004394 [Formica fusca]